MTSKVISPTVSRVLRYVVVSILFVVVIVLLMMWLMGVFHAKIDTAPPRTIATWPVEDVPTITVRTLRVPVNELAVGSIRPVHETSVASKILAKVRAVHVKAGQAVGQGDVMVELDDADLKSRRDQAAASLDAARAARDQAKIELERVQRLYDQQSASRIELDRIQTAIKSAEAEFQRATDALGETETILGYATIKASLTGTVVDKKVDAGDMVTPGQILVTLYDPTRMQLVASVRESLAHRLRIGQLLPVKVDAINKLCEGQVSEIVPEAESASRSFSVKVTGPCPAGVYTGMFGRLVIPLDEEEVLVVPRSVIRRVGQLTILDVVEGEFLRRRAVQLGRSFGEDVEVLSGLREGEKVVVPEAQK